MRQTITTQVSRNQTKQQEQQLKSKPNETNKPNTQKDIFFAVYHNHFCCCCCALDVDECSLSEAFCDVNADCQNTRGSYRCLCKPGFTGDERTCSGMMIFMFSDIFMTHVSKLNKAIPYTNAMAAIRLAELSCTISYYYRILIILAETFFENVCNIFSRWVNMGLNQMESSRIIRLHHI